MRQLFTLSKENLEFSKEEVLRLYHADKYKLTENLLVIDSDKDYSSYLAYTNEVYELLFDCKHSDLEKTIKSFDWNRIYKKSFSVRIVNNKTFDERKIAGIIYHKIKNPKVDLENAKTRIVFLNTKKKVLCGLLKSEIDKSFLKRKAHLRPELHPTSLNPKLARAAINLTGKAKGTLLDPFCGSGGILIEAGLMGFEVTGFDIDRIMVKRSKINLEYYEIKKYDIKLFDATKVKKKYDCIVTDLPYGRNSKLSGEIKALYKSFLKAAHNSTDSAVILFPDFIEYKKLLGKWKEVSSFDYYLHKSLSKKIVILAK
jgi:tRNA (guanine10-N2)-dimethyltransferase